MDRTEVKEEGREGLMEQYFFSGRFLNEMILKHKKCFGLKKKKEDTMGKWSRA